jgi:isochorismate synthase
LTQAQDDWTGKERNEQSVTSGFIEENVLELGILPKETAIQELEMGNIKHLVSEWYFPLERGSLDGLIQRLHPTPAVGGYPQDWAVDFILKHEGFDRGLYSGFIGVETPTEAMYHVVLRCCRFGCNGYVLYAGCGVNADSDPETEWAETSAKMQLISAYL